MDSKKSILVLNDDCLFVIFTYLNVRKLIELELMCDRFQTVVQMVYKTQHVLDYEKLVERNERLKMKDMFAISARLGPYVHTLNVSSFMITDSNSAFLENLLQDFRKLKSLRMHAFYIREINFERIEKVFEQLETVKIINCEASDKIESWLRKGKNLRNLALCGNYKIRGKCLAVLENMIHLNLEACEMLELSHFRTFCERNPGLKSLKITGYVNISTDFLKVVVKHLKGLERIKAVDVRRHTDFRVLGELKHLKLLEIGEEHIISIFSPDSCLERLLVWDTLEHISLMSSYFKKKTLRTICSFTKLKVLKFRSNQDLNDDHLLEMSYSKALINLHTLTLYYCSGVSDTGILAFIKNCKYLTKLTVIDDRNYGVSYAFIKWILPFLDERPAPLLIRIPRKILEDISRQNRDMMTAIQYNPKIRLVAINPIYRKYD